MIKLGMQEYIYLEKELILLIYWIMHGTIHQNLPIETIFAKFLKLGKLSAVWHERYIMIKLNWKKIIVLMKIQSFQKME